MVTIPTTQAVFPIELVEYTRKYDRYNHGNGACDLRKKGEKKGEKKPRVQHRLQQKLPLLTKSNALDIKGSIGTKSGDKQQPRSTTRKLKENNY